MSLVKDAIRQYNEFWTDDVDPEFYEFGGLPIPMSFSWKRICINLSGGADSALLMSALCKIIQDNKLETKVDAISFVRCWSNRPWQPFIGEAVFEKIKSIFPDIVDKQHKPFIAPELEHAAIGFLTEDNKSASSITTRSFNDFHCFYNDDVGAVFHGRTKNSRDLQDHPWRMQVRDDPREEDMVERLNYSGKYVFRPLLLVEKDWVVDQYIQNDWLDLFDTTRSCETNIEEFEKGWRYRAEDPIPECGICYWCVERNWSLKKTFGSTLVFDDVINKE